MPFPQNVQRALACALGLAMSFFACLFMVSDYQPHAAQAADEVGRSLQDEPTPTQIPDPTPIIDPVPELFRTLFIFLLHCSITTRWSQRRSAPIILGT